MKNIGYIILRILLDIESWHFRVDKINQENSSQRVYLEIFYIASQLDIHLKCSMQPLLKQLVIFNN
jgi:hypothetical protein